MAVREADLPGIIIERLEASYPAPAIFTADEITDWPDEILSGLQASGLLQPADRADFVICDGCHWGCYKPVVFRRSATGTRAFIVCNEEPDLGRIGITIERLQQYRSTLSLLAQFLGNSFQLTAQALLSGPPPLLLGHVKGRYGTPAVSLLLQDGRIIIQIGSYTKSAVEYLAFQRGQMATDRAALRRLANRKPGARYARPRYQPDKTKQQRRANKTAQRDRAIWAEALRIHSQTGKKLTGISREIARSRRFKDGRQQPLGERRIYRIIYEQQQKLGANFSAQKRPS